MIGHRLEIVKGRGTWLAGCSCGATYKAPGSRLGSWIASEVSDQKIREAHRAHKEDVK